jgi:hypothetical protein
MGTLKRFYRNVLQNNLSFAADMHEERIHTLELESHLVTVTYNDFTLTDAVRPSFDLKIIPEQGYKYERLKPNDTTTPKAHWLKPILVVSVSLEHLFETFLDLLDPLGSTVSVVLETSHCDFGARLFGLRRERMDLPVLKSFLYDHEELLLHDGCTGIAVFAPKLSAGVRFDEHKLMMVQAKSLYPFEKILHQHNILRKDTMPLLTDAEHIHITRDESLQRFRDLRVSLGMDERYTTAR